MSKHQRNSAIILLSLAALASSCSRPGDTTVDTPLSPVTLLTPTNTVVVATLDAPIPQGKNVVWCASFLAAWRTLADKVAQEPISFTELDTNVAALNSAPDPRPAIPTNALYVASGWKQQGI